APSSSSGSTASPPPPPSSGSTSRSATSTPRAAKPSSPVTAPAASNSSPPCSAPMRGSMRLRASRGHLSRLVDDLAAGDDDAGVGGGHVVGEVLDARGGVDDEVGGHALGDAPAVG